MSAPRPAPVARGQNGGALAGARDVPFWLDTADRPPRRPALDEDLTVDLAVVGGGFTGLWAALLAIEENPSASVVVLEAGDLGWAASGRNGGFCSASLTHGLSNGLSRWPGEITTLLRLGQENLDAIEQTIERYRIDADFTRSGDLTVAVEPWQLADLEHEYGAARGLGYSVELLDAAATRDLVDSPTYLGGLRDARGTALVDPARLVWGLAAAAEDLGVRIVERTRAISLEDDGDRVTIETGAGDVRARQVLLATNAFPSPLHRVRPFIVPVWDHVLVTEPLSPTQLSALGWSGREGLSDGGNQFHYYRLTADNRLLWGGYDALYYFGGDLSARRRRNPATESLLAEHLLTTFPQLDGVQVSHAWGGAIDTCTRFTPFWLRALGGKAVSVQGYTGLGVGASRFGAQVSLDLLAGRRTERSQLEMVRRPPLPFPPEPARWLAIQATRRAIARADAADGRRGVWLRTLDRFGLGFDS